VTLHRQPSAAFFSERPVPAPLKTFFAELVAFTDAILSPSGIIGEVEHMLRLRADGIEATDPQGAATLRKRAARVGLY
jgi:hypothetical protein